MSQFKSQVYNKHSLHVFVLTVHVPLFSELIARVSGSTEAALGRVSSVDIKRFGLTQPTSTLLLYSANINTAKC